MAPKRKADGPLGAPSKAYRQGKLFSFFTQQAQKARAAGTGKTDGSNSVAAASQTASKASATAASAESIAKVAVSQTSPNPSPVSTEPNSNAPLSQTQVSQTKASQANPDWKTLQLGDRIDVYWPDDDEYYAAKISKRQDQAAARFFIIYDDGQDEWIDLATATFRLSTSRASSKKRGRIQDDDDDEEEAEFVMPESDDDGSVYQDDKKGRASDDEDEDDQWIVSDDDDEEVASSKKKKLKIVAHKTPARSTGPTSSGSQKTTNTSAITPKQITPAFAQATYAASEKSTPALAAPSRNSYQSPTMAFHPTATTEPSSTPLMYQRDIVNPAGSHVHNHLKFLMPQYRRDARGRPTSDPNHDRRTLWIDRAELEKHCGKLTDGVQQWWDLKAQYFDTVLLFKTGKFYELFHMDADVGVQVCGHCYMKGHIAHSGFPEAAYGKFADMMVRAGYKVCRVEQTETPEQLKERKKMHKGKGAPKVVNREVCSILTAGTRTYCILDRIDDTADASSAGVGPLLAIREVMLDPSSSSEDEDDVQPVCEYGVTLVDSVRGVVTVGQFADDVLRSRMHTLLLTFQPSEILLQGGSGGASRELRGMIQTLQRSSGASFGVDDVLSEESFPKSNATDPSIRRRMERRGIVHPWDAEETLEEIHRRGYYPRASKKEEDRLSVSRWPPILQAIVEGQADLAISSFGAALFYLQRNLIDMELLSMGLVKAYVPPLSSVAQETNGGSIGILAAEQAQKEGDVGATDGGDGSSFTSSRNDTMETGGPFVQNVDDVANMALDGTTLMNLEILANNADNKPNGSLWSLINHTKTPHGNRLLRAWLLRPLFRKADIERRTDAVQDLVSGNAAVALSEAATLLSKCGDLERLLSRVHSMGVSPSELNGGDEVGVDIHPSQRAVLYETATYTRRMVSDFSSLLSGLRQVDGIPELFDGIEIQSGLLTKIVRRMDQGGRFPNMTESLDWFFNNFDCDKARQGKFEPARGIDADYDASCEAIERILVELEHYKNHMSSQLSPASVARSTWKYINTKPDSKDKFLIELPSNIAVPSDFIVKGKRGTGAKQVMKYRSLAVDRLVQELDHAYDVQNQRRALGMKLIFSKFDSMRHLWAAVGQATALLDALISLAKASASSGYSRATILDCPPGSSSSISVVQGRHPIVEKTLKSGDFVPNDLSLGSNDKRVLLLSGVNMGGKSTCLRQTCLLAIMAQIGCFVPAESLELTPVDRIYTRLGASDRILMGQSTFFVELAENAAALRGATSRSLVIMDELGRGTSTFDGTAIASATVKHLVERTKCISLFATHYHTLLDEWQTHPNVQLGHMECVVETGNVTTRQDSGDCESTITFLYTLGEGIFPKSFGINVARLAGLPPDVISNAARISSEFEREMQQGSASHAVVTSAKARDIKQQYLVAMKSDDWETSLANLVGQL